MDHDHHDHDHMAGGHDHHAMMGGRQHNHGGDEESGMECSMQMIVSSIDPRNCPDRQTKCSQFVSVPWRQLRVHSL